MAAKIVSLTDAVAELVHDGDTVALEGFTHLIPFAAGHEIIRQHRRDLTLVRMTPDLVYDQMVGAGCARKLIFSWGGNPGVGSLYRVRDAITAGWPVPLQIEEHTHAGLANRYVAGAAGLPFAVLRASAGTDLPRHTPTVSTVRCPFTGEELTAVAALNPDVAIIHAQRADRAGNVQLWGITGVQKEAVLAAEAVAGDRRGDRGHARPGAGGGGPAAVGGLPRWPRCRAARRRRTRTATTPATTAPTWTGRRRAGTARRSRAGSARWSGARGTADRAQRGSAMTHTADEMMTVAAARELRDGQAVFVGIGLPSRAANLARRLHAPDLALIYESGTIDTRPDELPLSIGDGVLAETGDCRWSSVPEVFNYWLQAGRIDVGFLSGAQIDRFANINTTVIGEYAEPDVRLPGAGGAPEIAASCREVIVVMRHRRRAVRRPGRLRDLLRLRHGPGDRGLLGLRGAGPVRVITDLGVLEPDPESRELHAHRAAPRRHRRAGPRRDRLVAGDRRRPRRDHAADRAGA